MKLDDSIAAIVTGAASGLGEAAARALAAEGVKVTIFDRNAERGAAVAREIGGHFVGVDVADDRSVASGVAEAEQRHGVARIAVNCAGIAPAAKTVGKGNAPHPLEVFRNVMEINLIGTFNVTSKVAARLAADELRGEERGVIVNTPFPSRLGEPSEYALLVKSIILNPMLNGETIRLDGAIRMTPR